jgi:hypothetical protein
VISSIQGSLEFDHVRPNDIGVQPKEIALGKERRLGQGLAKDIGRDLEQVASAFAIAFRPQGRDQAVATETPSGRQSEEGEQGHTVPLRGSAGSGPAVALERRASKRRRWKIGWEFKEFTPPTPRVHRPFAFLVDATAAHPAVQACGCCRATNLYREETSVMVRRFTLFAALLAAGSTALAGCGSDQEAPVAVSTVRLAIVPGASTGAHHSRRG